MLILTSKSSESNKSSGGSKASAIAAEIVNKEPVQIIAAYGDAKIGEEIVKAAEKNAANAWHDVPVASRTLSKMLPKESGILQEDKSVVGKGAGVFAIGTLGINAWDNFANYGLVSGGKRFEVDLLSSVVGAGVGVLTAPLPGGFVWGTGISMLINEYTFEPWKDSIK